MLATEAIQPHAVRTHDNCGMVNPWKSIKDPGFRSVSTTVSFSLTSFYVLITFVKSK